MSGSSLLRRAEAIFDAIADLPEPARSTELERRTDGDASLAELVRRLLASDSASGGFLETPARAVDAALRSLDRTARELPTTIGDYKVVALIGEGGMGAVYEAQQENPRRAVAVKVIRAGAASPESLARFRREAQLLGVLHHPGIAAIYEAGHADVVYPSGTLRHQPYFVMEYVRGEGLSDYLGQQSPSLRERLELFAVASIIRNVYARKGDDENAIKWTSLTFSHRLLAAGDNEIESLTKGIDEVERRLTPYGLESRTVSLLTADGNTLAPLKHPRRARFFANLARACNSTGRRVKAREALATAKEALSYSVKPDVDGALIDSISISE